MAMAAASRSPREPATSWVPTVRDRWRSVSKKVDQVKKSQKVTGLNLVAGKVFHLKFPFKSTHLIFNYVEVLIMWQMYNFTISCVEGGRHSTAVALSLRTQPSRV